MKIHRHYWKRRVKIRKVAKYESEMSKASEDIALKSKHFKDVCITVAPTIQTSVKSRDFADPYPRYFSTHHSQTWQLY